ncbi:MAG: IS481 family transposase, partial [Bacteroidota bacterium]
CGISRPTLRKWSRRYEAEGEAGLHSRSRRPKRLRPSNVDEDLRERILALRRERNLGPKRIQAELLRHDGIKRSTSTIWKVLHRAEVGPLHRPKRYRKPKRYTRPVPGDRVQIDSMKVAPNLYQFTAVDDCTRLRVLGLYPDRSAASAKQFLIERVLPEFPFPLQRVQTDQGAEFCSEAFHGALHERKIKFRPNRPRAPHLNGKVERSQRTDKVEFYALADLSDAALPERLGAWQRFYNADRPHSSLGGKTPLERYHEVAALVPTRGAIAGAYDTKKERWNVRPMKRRWVLRL